MIPDTWSWLTPNSMGAIGLLQVTGKVDNILHSLTGRSTWQQNKLYLVKIDDIDEAVAVKTSSTCAHLMPHGGIQIRRKLDQKLIEIGARNNSEALFPEANSPLESQVLNVLSKAQSPLAAHLLLQQLELLQGVTPTEYDLKRSALLDHLIHPPTVVLLGAPNTGKSTLMNALSKQNTSIVHDQAGATRDAVGARIDCAGLIINLYDLPGFRETEDLIERDAIKLARKLADNATLTLLINDHEQNWLECKTAHLKVRSKSELGKRTDADVCVSAEQTTGIEKLCLAIRNAIVPDTLLESPRPWFFNGYSPTEE
mgnify:CR=1 FL=1